MKVELTRSQCSAVADFIERNILDIIRNDEGIEDFDYLEDLINARKTLFDAANDYEVFT